LTFGLTYVPYLFMCDASARRERQDAVLAELSELGLSLARELHARALAAETPVEAEKLALAFQRVSRGVRQTLALELKLDRDRRALDREVKLEELEGAIRLAEEAAAEARAEARKPDPVDPAIAQHRNLIAARKDRVKGALTRLIWHEAEGDEHEIEILDEDLDYRLREAARREDFLDIPFETLVRQIKADMDLSGDLRLTACETPKPPPMAPDLAYGAADTG
jgi:hypothetical protein